MVYEIIKREIQTVLEEITDAMSKNEPDAVGRLTGKLEGLHFALDNMEKFGSK